MQEIVSTKENYIYEKLPNNKSTITHTSMHAHARTHTHTHTLCNKSGNTHNLTKDLNQ
jgi:hypothetical protein